MSGGKDLLAVDFLLAIKSAGIIVGIKKVWVDVDSNTRVYAHTHARL